MRRIAIAASVAGLLALPAVAHAKGRLLFEDTVPVGKSTFVEMSTHKPASFRVVLRVPTHGRARLFLLGKNAPRGGPLIDTKTFACEGAAGSFYCRASYEPLPRGRYTWRIAWTGRQAAHVELTLRW